MRRWKLVMTMMMSSAAVVTTATTTGASPTFFSLLPQTDINNNSPSFLRRSSRSFYTIIANVADYKYSLYGLSPAEDSLQYTQILSQVHLRSAKRLLKLCEMNQGFYIKAGQFVASMRQVPKEYSSTLASLQDQAVPCSFQAIKEVLVNNLGSDLEEIFLSIDEKPIAAASIAQVHRAVLKDHQEVVLKVQYPGLKDRMRMDIATMSLAAKWVTWFFPEYRFNWMVSEFSELIALELDFIEEAKNSVRTATNFKNNSRIIVPKVFQELTTSQVLTMQYCKGRKIDDLEFIREMGIDSRKVAKVLTEAFAEMVFVHGFVHGDPHPGNILVSPDEKEGFLVVLLDHGIYRRLDEEFRVNYCELWKALILLDSRKIEQVGQFFGIGKYAKYLPLIFTGRTINSKAGLGDGMSIEEKTNLKEEVKLLTVGNISEFMESLPSEFLTVLRTDALIRSLTSKLGSPSRVRLLIYANYALDGLSSKRSSEADCMLKSVNYRVNLLQFRLLLDLAFYFYWVVKSLPKVAKVLTEAFAEMVFVHGFVHGDPHPGNILVSPDEKEGFLVVLLDHGIYRRLDEEFRVNYCELWKALILLDSRKIEQVGQFFGIGKYAKYLPLIFTGRTINSKAGLGDGMSIEEKTNLKEEVKLLTVGNISEFMESLPSEFLTVLRTDALIRSLTSKLGSPSRVRLLIYANYALDGLSSKRSSEADCMLKSVNYRVNLLQFRLLLGLLQLLSWLTDARHVLVAWSKQIMLLISRLVKHGYMLEHLF